MNAGYIRDRFCEPREVTIPVDSIGLNRGYAAFDFLKIVDQRPFYAERHLQRFFNTMRMLRIQIPQSLEAVLGIIESLASRSHHPYFGLKIFAVPIETDGLDMMPADLCIVPVVLTELPPAAYCEGCKLITFEYARFLPEAKSTHYLPSVFWEPEVKRKGALEPLFHFGGKVLETARSNVFVCKDGALYTPGVHVLKGVTRSVVIDLCKELRLSVNEQDVSLEALYQADEVFVTSTTKGVAPIVVVDEKPIANGNVGKLSKALIEGYQRVMRQS